VQIGECQGPDRLMHSRGRPVTVPLAEQALDEDVAHRLWLVLEQLKGAQDVRLMIAAPERYHVIVDVEALSGTDSAMSAVVPPWIGSEAME
jgi:hypothetical protein